MKTICKKIINVAQECRRQGRRPEEALYFATNGIPCHDGRTKKLIGISYEVYSEENGEQVFCGYDTVYFTKQERQVLERAGLADF